MSATLIFIGANVNNADGYFGYWSNIKHHYSYSCSGSESSLTSCSYLYTSHHCYSSSDEAGVRCINTSNCSTTL